MAVEDTGLSTESSKPPDRAPHLQPFRWKKGQRPPGGGKPKGLISLRRRFREAFQEDPTGNTDNLVDSVLALARGKVVRMEKVVDGEGIRFEYCYVESKLQMEAIKFAAAYGFGMPSKNLDDDTVHRLAEQVIKQAVAEAESRKAAALEATTVDVAGEVTE